MILLMEIWSNNHAIHESESKRFSFCWLDQVIAQYVITHWSRCLVSGQYKRTNDFTKYIACYETNTLLQWSRNCNYIVSAHHPGYATFSPQQTITQKVQGRHCELTDVLYNCIGGDGELSSWINVIVNYVISIGNNCNYVLKGLTSPQLHKTITS
jgi:hypothetical protein